MASISVYVRLRPFLSHQKNEKPENQRITLSENSQQVKVELTDTKEKYFKFNSVFSPNQQQRDIYDGIETKQLVQRVLDGYHSTIFAYGQTGSGKTYTIEGGESQQSLGIIPRTIRELYSLLASKNHNQRDYKIFVSFIQIYNEGIYDLIDINDGKPLKMRWNKHQQFIVENIFEGQCRTSEQALRWWKKGQKNKIMGAHKMNNTSSRSHCILTLRVHSYDLEDPSDKIESKLEIVDLAGSQRQKVTKSTGVIFREGIEINKSLFTLRQVIASLYEASTNQKVGQKTIPPYRDSKLTSLLKQSIGGNSYCVMIACLNPTSDHFEESLQTLTYASMASYISNVPIKNIDPKIQQNQQLKDQNHQLKLQLKKMSDHIEYLTKLLEANECLECKKKVKKIESLHETQKEETFQPTGIVSFPKLPENQKEKILERKSPQKNYQKIMHDKTFSVQKRAIKSTKQIIESITMIKDLITANTSLRDKIQNLKAYIQKQEKQTFTLMKQNQVLRDRWDMINGSLLPEIESRGDDEAPIAAYQRLVRQQRGDAYRLSEHYLTTQKSETEGVSNHNKISYNDFLRNGNRKRDKKQNLINRRKYRINSESKRINQITFNV